MRRVDREGLNDVSQQTSNRCSSVGIRSDIPPAVSHATPNPTSELGTNTRRAGAGSRKGSVCRGTGQDIGKMWIAFAPPRGHGSAGASPSRRPTTGRVFAPTRRNTKRQSDQPSSSKRDVTRLAAASKSTSERVFAALVNSSSSSSCS